MNVRLAIIGDVHLHFNELDVSYFNSSEYDLILFVGDLVNYAPWRGKSVWPLIQKLEKTTLFMPGNHDATNVFQLIAEVLGNQKLAVLSGLGQRRNYQALLQSLSNTTFCGYSHQAFDINGLRFDIIAGRPFSMGGPNLSFRPHLRKAFAVESMEASANLIKEQVDQSQNKNVIFFAHNGPSGLGNKRDDIWGCDFKKSEGDFGDPDLEEAIDYARQQGKNVMAVIAGHMHQHLKGGGERTWHLQKDGTHYVNAARVPRIFEKSGQTLHHHVCLEINSDGIQVMPKEIAL